jgi:hypothetical protein
MERRRQENSTAQKNDNSIEDLCEMKKKCYGSDPNRTKEIPGFIRDYFENLYLNKLENLEELDKFLDTYDHLKLNQEYINHLNRSVNMQ